MLPASSASSGSISTTPPAATAARTAAATSERRNKPATPAGACPGIARDPGDPGHLSAVHHERGVGAAVVLGVFGHLVPEELLEEPDGGLRLRRQQLGPGQGAGLLAPGRPEVGARLPGSGGSAAGRGEENHDAGVTDRLRAEFEAPGGMRQFGSQVPGVVDREIHVPPCRLARGCLLGGSAARARSPKSSPGRPSRNCGRPGWAGPRTASRKPPRRRPSRPPRPWSGGPSSRARPRRILCAGSWQSFRSGGVGVRENPARST